MSGSNIMTQDQMAQVVELGACSQATVYRGSDRKWLVFMDVAPSPTRPHIGTFALSAARGNVREFASIDTAFRVLEAMGVTEITVRDNAVRP